MTYLTVLVFALASCDDGRREVDEGNAQTADVGRSSGTDEATTGAAQSNDGRLWVTSQRADRRTCPSTQCGVVGQYIFREAVTAMERSGAWVRVSRHYDAACRAGRSAYVEEGRAACTAENGIIDGRLAEWVDSSALGTTRPADPAKTASNAERLVAQSDDFAQHRAAFTAAASQLLTEGRCAESDFLEMGGWLKATLEYRDRPVYFTYCGGMTAANRLYLDVSTGRIFR